MSLFYCAECESEYDPGTHDECPGLANLRALPANTALSGAQRSELSTQLRDRKTPSPEEE